MQDKTLYLIRGLPGSGKSTLAETLAKSLEATDYFEADDYFYKWNGHVWVYEFDPMHIGEAHTYCRTITRRAMQASDPNVIVSNTFTREKELKPYLDLAEEHGYRVVSLIVENRHGNESVHAVPDATIQKMRDRFSVKL